MHDGCSSRKAHRICGLTFALSGGSKRAKRGLRPSVFERVVRPQSSHCVIPTMAYEELHRILHRLHCTSARLELCVVAVVEFSQRSFGRIDLPHFDATA